MNSNEFNHRTQTEIQLKTNNFSKSDFLKMKTDDELYKFEVTHCYLKYTFISLNVKPNPLGTENAIFQHFHSFSFMQYLRLNVSY